MKKKLQKMLAVFLTLCMCMSLLGLQVLAAETTTTETVQNADQTVTTTTTTTTTETDPETGKTTVIVKINTTITDADGNVIYSEWSEDGTENDSWTEEASNGPEVTVPLEPGEKTKGSATETTTTTTGDVPTGPNDTSYDYTQTTTTTNRTVTAETGEVEITTNESSTDLTSVAPEAYEGKQDVGGVGGTNSLGWDTLNLYAANVEQPDAEGYDYQYVGLGEYAAFKGIQYMDVVYLVDEKTGEPITNEEGNYIIASSTSQNVQAQQFSLKDAEGNYYYVYCVDRDTATVNGTWYTVSNLEDGNYYASEDAADHIRAIVTNGYWGASNEADEDGSYKTGSLQSIKENVKTAIKNGEIEDSVVSITTDEEGNEIPVMLSDIINDLTEGEALSVTQAAIWSYSNGSLDAQDGKNGAIIVDPAVTDDEVSEARMMAVYNWLMSLKSDEDTTTTTVINEQNFVKDLSLTVGDKVGEKIATDEDNNEVVNGIYETALNFTLAFTPSEDGDDLLVHVSYTDLEGKDVTVTKRLAGTNGEGENHETITADENGNYTISGLKLSENEDFDFDLRLEGTQHLDQGVYIYTAYGGTEVAQTMVGLAEGTHTVDVNASMTISFSVNEENKVVAERIWHDEGFYSYVPPVVPDETPEEEIPEEKTPTTETPEGEEIPDEGGDGNPDEEEILEEEVPAAGADGDPDEEEVFDEEIFEEEIFDEEIPLAEVPETGDISGLWMAMAALSGSGLIGLNVLTKKRKDDEE